MPPGPVTPYPAPPYPNVVDMGYYPGSPSYDPTGYGQGAGAFINWMDQMYQPPAPVTQYQPQLYHRPSSVMTGQGTGIAGLASPSAGGGVTSPSAATLAGLSTSPAAANNPLLNRTPGTPTPASGAPVPPMGPSLRPPGAGAGGRPSPGAGGRPSPGSVPGGGGGGGGGGVGGMPTTGQTPPGNGRRIVQAPDGRYIELDELGHGDYGEGYDSLGHIAYGSRGTGPTGREMSQMFETLKAGGMVFWPGSYSTWFAAGQPLASDLSDAEKQMLTNGGDWNDIRQYRMFNQANGVTPPGQQPGQPAPGAGGQNPPNWMVPGMGNVSMPWEQMLGLIGGGGGQYPPMNPGFGDGGLQPQLPPGTRPLGPYDKMLPDGSIHRGGNKAAIPPGTIVADYIEHPGGPTTLDQVMGPGRGGMPGMPKGMAGGTARGLIQPSYDQNLEAGVYNPVDAAYGNGYMPPAFTQPSYDQATFPGLSDEQVERLMAFNNNMALPWSEFLRNSYNNDRDYSEDVRRFNQNFGEDTRRWDTTFGEDQFRDRRNYDTDVFRDNRDYGENVRRYDQGFQEDQRRYDQGFGEGVRQFDTNFGENQRQFNQNFGENQRQFNENFFENRRQFDQSLDWQKINDAMRTFGARQMPNVRQVSFR